MTDADFPRVVEVWGTRRPAGRGEVRRCMRSLIPLLLTTSLLQATKYSNAVAFLIDASCSMLQETVMVPQGQEMQETSSLQLAVDAIMAVARDQACSSEAQALGVLLYNTVGPGGREGRE